MKIFDIFFIDRFNYATLQEHANKGDLAAFEINRSIGFFSRNRQDEVCGICHRPHAIGRSTTFVVVLTKDTLWSLTTCICSKCAKRDDLDKQISEAIGQWPHQIDDCDHVFDNDTVH